MHLREGLSVRKVEELAQESKTDKPKKKTKAENPYETVQRHLSKALGLKVKVQEGKVTIAFTSEDELQQIVDRLS